MCSQFLPGAGEFGCPSAGSRERDMRRDLTGSTRSGQKLIQRQLATRNASKWLADPRPDLPMNRRPERHGR